MRRLAALLLLLSASACVRRVPGPTELLDDAVAHVGEGKPRTLALAGWQALLVTGDADRAKTLFGQALAKDPGEPYALYGVAQLADRVGHPEQALAAALDLCERAPAHPLAAAGARIALDAAGDAASMDELLLARVPKIVERGIGGDASQLLRSALATVLLARDDPGHAKVLADMGVPTTATLVGPLSPLHRLSMATPTAAEKTGALDNLGAGPFGPLTPRTLRFADGRFSLGGEPPAGDVYLLGYDAEVKTAGLYTLRTITSMDHVAVLDGTKVIERSTWRRPAPGVAVRVVRLSAGTHRLVVRMAREEQTGFLTTALMRLDGAPSDVTWKPAAGPAPSWSGVRTVDEGAGLYPSAQALYEALLDEAGGALARFIAARDALSRDRDGAWRLLAGLPDSVAAPAVRLLRADLAIDDHSLPQKVARGRATRDLEAAVAKDKSAVRAMMAIAQNALDDGRQLDALEQLKVARAASEPPGAPLLSLQARVELALGLDAQAAVTAREAEKALGGYCEALQLEYDLARRRDAVAESDALLEATAHCPGALSRAAEQLRQRGDLAGAAKAWEALLARDESQAQVAVALAQIYVAQKRHDEAIALLGRLRAQWPRNDRLARELADVFEAAGRAKDALAVREEVLLLDGDDLALRRSVERAKTGKELLEPWAISTEEALKAYEAAPGNEEATVAFILDAAAIRAYPDGSQVDRIHVIQKALDQAGVSEAAEVQVPQGAVVLKLRTLKKDGSTLEPEGIDGKDTVSLPGVQVGDLVEYEYLLAHPTRGPGQPGFTASNFYFQVARQPNNWSTYRVIAPKGAGMKVDAHNMESAQPKVEGDLEVYFHEERRVPPYIPEPLGSPSGNEWLPFVSVGAGQTGNEGTVAAYADAFLDKGVITWEVERFAKEAAKDKQGLEAVKAVYVATMNRLSGRDAGLTLSASGSVAQDRGSRVWLMEAALAALGFEVRLVAVRTFTADPAPYLFPAEGLLPYVCLRVTLPDGRFVWLDPLVRYAPFGELPEFALGEREAYLFPMPGKPLEKVKTPPRNPRPGKEVTLSLTVGEDGVLTGTGEELYTGFEAAQLSEALESLSPDQRDQALQQALSRYFGGADLSSLEVDAKREVGAAVRVKYGFKAQRFGRVETDRRMILGPLTFPALVGRRFLSLGRRRTALFIEASESTRTTAKVTLPKGWVLRGAAPVVKLESAWGSFLRRELQQGEQLSIEEEYQLRQARVPVEQYEAFGQFAGEVDLVQGRDLVLEKP